MMRTGTERRDALRKCGSCYPPIGGAGSEPKHVEWSITRRRRGPDRGYYGIRYADSRWKVVIRHAASYTMVRLIVATVSVTSEAASGVLRTFLCVVVKAP